ncbi:MAG: hybrid sensor histidine kinase/response regulator [Spirochaetaceae bacterium]|jgi:C4-dicarboxylate-specific signal transduction histidine kinase|nr:hybrid sensor histidine kinase/response regulator [Spirochaetaceae bacterium]
MEATRNMLIIDDDSIVRESISDFFEDSGYNVYQCSNGKDGIDKLREINPTVILCDLHMPGISGLEVIDVVKNEKPEMPLIVVSGNGIIKDAIEAVSRGAWNYVMKPIYDLSELELSVEMVIEKADLIKNNRLYKEGLEIEVEKRTRELFNLNKDLEKRVAERTSELESSIKVIKEAQAKLVQSEKMAALGGLVAGVAHEINTPVGVGITAASHMETATKDFEKLFEAEQMKKSDLQSFLSTTKEASRILLTNLTRAAQLIQGFKQVSVDQTAGGKRVINIKEYIDKILMSLHPKIKLTKHVIKIICQDKLMVNTFPGALSQILTNLIMNSLSHAYEEDYVGTITITIEKKNNFLEIEYKDDGKGIGKEFISHVFDPFFTTKRASGGTGLGLNIVYNLVTQKLNGQISCSSTVGEGTAFNFTIEIDK